MTEALRFLDACDTWSEILHRCRIHRESHLFCHELSPDTTHAADVYI